jgi:DNA topoisomerase-2
MATTSSAPPAKRPKYTKLTQTEHVLIRPGMYIGPTAPDGAEEWVITEDGAGFERKQVTVSRGLVGIVNELLVNVRDVVTRYPEEPAKLSLSVSDGWITVTNTGPSHYVDVSINEEHQLYNPEMVFTELRSGTNFDDSEDRLTGGQNGLGAKLALIFSSEAVIEVGDPIHQRKFSQRVAKNLNEKSTPKITSYKKQKGFVSISIRPEMKRFGMAPGGPRPARHPEGAVASRLPPARRRA